MKFFAIMAASAIGANAICGGPKMISKSNTTPSGKWIPERFSTGDDDQLMKNLIEQGLAFTKDKGFTDKYQFKTEPGCGCNNQSCICCMKKHTHYWIDKKGAFEAAKVIVGTNLHLEGEKLNKYLSNPGVNENFLELWEKYDILKTGWVEIEQMSSFYKALMNDVTISI